MKMSRVVFIRRQARCALMVRTRARFPVNKYPE